MPTTIPVSQTTKHILADEKREGETWDQCLRRLVDQAHGDQTVTNEDIHARLEHLADRIRTIEANLKDLAPPEGRP